MIEGFKAIDVKSEKLTIKAYYKSGSKMPLVFMHGITDNAFCFSRVVEKFSDHAIVLYDARGHGLSDRASDYSIKSHVNDALAVLSEFKVERPLAIGHSMGAVNLANLAASSDYFLGGIFLEDPPWLDLFPEKEGLEYIASWKETSLRRARMSLDSVNAEGRIEHPGWTDEEYAEWAEAKIQADPEVLSWLYDENVYTGWKNFVGKINTPLIVLTGDNSLGAYINSDVSRGILERNPSARITNISAGHSIRRDAFVDYIKALEMFIEEINRR
ncbi:MAG: alpha/beta hydrolase [Spirochaetes bacterium]|nr:alpha/beta hydrolase [Spirochaetota bacterium]